MHHRASRLAEVVVPLVAMVRGRECSLALSAIAGYAPPGRRSFKCLDADGRPHPRPGADDLPTFRLDGGQCSENDPIGCPNVQALLTSTRQPCSDASEASTVAMPSLTPFSGSSSMHFTYTLVFGVKGVTWSATDPDHRLFLTLTQIAK